MSKQVNKEQKDRPQGKAYKSRLLQWWNTLCMGQNKVPKNLQADIIGLETNSGVCNFIFS